MDYEKAYKEALGRARKIKSGEGIPASNGWDIVDVLFPELNETEDEKIKKKILELVSISGNGNDWEEINNWLNKFTIVRWKEEDMLMLDEILFFINEFQNSDRCKDENDMKNSVSCEKWVKSLKSLIFGYSYLANFNFVDEHPKDTVAAVAETWSVDDRSMAKRIMEIFILANRAAKNSNSPTNFDREISWLERLYGIVSIDYPDDSKLLTIFADSTY